MKRHKILVLALSLLTLLLSVTNSFSQYGPSRGVIVGEGPGRQITIPPNSSTCGGLIMGFCGVIYANLNNTPDVPFYCVDICTALSPGDSIVDSSSALPIFLYITNNYYPSAPPLLSADDEACAVQLAIWHFRNLVPIDSVSVTGNGGNTIKARADTIIAQALANGGGTTLDVTLQILPASNSNDFFVRTTNTSGDPVAVDSITLSITGGGMLSTTLVSTDVTGNSPDVIVTGANNGSRITATGKVEIPAGVTYSGLNSIVQRVILGAATPGFRTASILWGTLPVELSSFTSSVHDRDVTLNWTTVSENNNSGFDIERSVAGSNEWIKTGSVRGFGSVNATHNYSFTEKNLLTGKYNYRLKQNDYNGNFEYHYLSGEVVIGVPVRFDLGQNYPNPFNPSTNVKFGITNLGFVSLKLYDALGKEVAQVVNELKEPGYYRVRFNASGLSSGIYYYRLESNGNSLVRKMMVVK